MACDLNSEPDPQRAHARTSMFVLASMAATSVSGPVKIRNMSAGGALIEGAALPRMGEHLLIRRGELSAAGQIVWRLEGKAGLRFDRAVDVTAWLPTAGSRQQQVDQTFQALKAESAAPPAVRLPATRAAASPIDRLDLLQTADAIDLLADLLAEDARIVASHSTKLQALDIASQLLRRCAVAIPAHPVEGEGAPTNVHPLAG